MEENGIHRSLSRLSRFKLARVFPLRQHRFGKTCFRDFQLYKGRLRLRGVL